MDTVLVTGGYGGLGSNICIEFAERGRRVVAHGRSGTPPTNIESAPAAVRRRIDRRTCDLRDGEELRRIVREEGVDGIVHSGALMPSSSKALRPSFEVNGGGTLSLLEAAAERQLDRFVYVGSGSVYPNRPPDGDPYTEDEVPRPTTGRAYSITKYIGELFCEFYRSAHGLDATTVRVSRLWGEPIVRTGDRAYPMDRILSELLDGRDVIYDEGGDHPNDYTHNRDAARGVVLAYVTPSASRQRSVYNVSGGRHITVGEISRVCTEAFDRTVRFGPGYWDELAQSVRPPFEISAARHDLGYDPRPFEERLREHVAYRRRRAARE